MVPEKLVRDRETRVTGLEATRNLLETEYRVETIGTSLDRLEIEEVGYVLVEGHRYPITRHFMECLAKHIKMPIGFADGIDFELFKTNFNVLKVERSKGITICVSNDIAVGIAKAGYRSAKTVDLIDDWHELSKEWEIQETSLSDLGVEINVIMPGQDISPEANDVVQIGMRISNSETGARGLKAAVLTYRLICRNGAILADNVGTVRWAYDRRMAYRSSVDAFKKQLVDLGMHARPRAERVYRNIPNRTLTDRQIIDLFRRLKSRVGDVAEAERILELDSERRKAMQDRVRHRPVNQPDIATDHGVYEVHNRITAAAHVGNFAFRRAMQDLGGGLLSLPSRN